MKKVFSVLCAILIASSMVISAFAAGDPSPKVEAPKPVEIVVTDGEGNEISVNVDEGEGLDDFIVLTTNPGEEEEETASVPEEVKKAIEQAETALQEMESLAEVDPAFEGKEALPVMNVRFSETIAEVLTKGGSVAVKTDIKMPNVEKDTRIPLIRFIDGQWVVSEDEYAEVLEDGTVVLHLNQPGEFTLVVDPETEVVTPEKEAE